MTVVTVVITSSLTGGTVMDANRLVRLKNNTEEPNSAVAAVMLTLRDMLNSGRLPDTLAFYDIVQFARGTGTLSGKALEIAKSRGLVERDGRMHDTIRSIILSAVTGDDAHMSLGSPYA